MPIFVQIIFGTEPKGVRFSFRLRTPKLLFQMQRFTRRFACVRLALFLGAVGARLNPGSDLEMLLSGDLEVAHMPVDAC